MSGQIIFEQLLKRLIAFNPDAVFERMQIRFRQHLRAERENLHRRSFSVAPQGNISILDTQ